MATYNWTTKPLRVASLHLDAKNPRLGCETMARAPHEIIQYLLKHDKAMEVARSIVARRYFPSVKRGHSSLCIFPHKVMYLFFSFSALSRCA